MSLLKHCKIKNNQSHSQFGFVLFPQLICITRFNIREELPRAAHYCIH